LASRVPLVLPELKEIREVPASRVRLEKAPRALPGTLVHRAFRVQRAFRELPVRVSRVPPDIPDLKALLVLPVLKA